MCSHLWTSRRVTTCSYRLFVTLLRYRFVIIDQAQSFLAIPCGAFSPTARFGKAKDQAKRLERARRLVTACLPLIEAAIAAGAQVIFENQAHSTLWKTPEFLQIADLLESVGSPLGRYVHDRCAYTKGNASDMYKKPTALYSTCPKAWMAELCQRCHHRKSTQGWGDTGRAHPDLLGRRSDGTPVTRSTARYTAGQAKAMAELVMHIHTVHCMDLADDAYIRHWRAKPAQPLATTSASPQRRSPSGGGG